MSYGLRQDLAPFRVSSERIATALERIATALERFEPGEPEPPPPEPPACPHPEADRLVLGPNGPRWRCERCGYISEGETA